MTSAEPVVERGAQGDPPTETADPAGRGGVSATGRIMQGGRSKAYRPLPAVERRAAFEAGLAAYRRGDFFEAHELLEPPWMGTADLTERDLYQGLIKLAAAYVHAVRGNGAGVETNLRGARQRLASAASSDPRAGDIDLPALIDAIDVRLERGPAAAVARPLADAPALPGPPVTSGS